MADPYTDRPVSAAMGLGLRVPSAGFNADPAMQSGLGSLRPTRADTAVVGTSVPPSPEQAIGGLRANIARQAENLMSMSPIATPQQQRPLATAYFNQATNEMFAGDRAFKADDVRSALEASQMPGNTTRPQGQGWVALPEGSFNDYLASFSERRGAGELLGLGARQVGEGLVSGVGALAEFAGATDVGPAIREFGQATFGQDENEQIRSALIAENSTLFERIIDGAWQAIPTLASMAVGGGVAGLGARALGAGATGIKYGAMAGGAATTFPMHVSSYYDAAVRNGYNPNDVKDEILGGALANTALDMFGVTAAGGRVASQFLRQTAEEAGKQAARRSLTRRAVGAGGVAFSEALTETLQTIGETALFDPEARDKFSTQDYKALASYLGETYGEDYLVSAGIGAFLGGGAGVVAEVLSGNNKPVDLNDTATGQATKKAAPLALPAPERQPTPLAITSIPGAQTMGAMAMPPQPGQSTLGPQDRAGAPSPLDPRTAPTVEGEVLPPLTYGQARLRGLPAPARQPSPLMLSAPRVSEADFYAGPEGVTSAGMTVAEPEVAASATPGELLRVGMAPRPLLVTGQTTDTAIGNQLRAREAARQAAAAKQAADQKVTAEATRQEQLTEAARQAQVEEAFAQRDVQQRALAENQVRVAEEQVATARTAWDKFRNKRRLTLVPKAKRAVEQSVEFDMLPPVAQQQWLDAVRKGKATEALYKRLRNAAPAPAPAVVPAPAAAKAPKASPKVIAVQQRLATLPPETMTTVMTILGAPDMAALDALVRTEPDRVAKAISEATKPPPGPGKGTKADTVRKPKPKPKAEIAPKAETPGKQDLKKGTKSEAAPEARPEPEPEPEPEIEVQAPAAPLTLGERVDALNERELLRLQQLLDAVGEPDIDVALETNPEAVDAALRALAGRKAPPSRTPEQIQEARQKELTKLSGTPLVVIQLRELITDFNSKTDKATKQFIDAFQKAAAAVRKSNPDAVLGLMRILDYANPDNTPNILTWPGGKRQIVPVGTTIEKTPGRNALSDWNTIDGMVDLNGKSVLPLPAGRVDLLVKNYLRKLKRPPTVTVARNQADLKTKNPALYRAAKASRPQGDFDTANALGFSFGDGQVIIFSDRIASEAQLNFVLAHESLGHYGLRAIMPADKFDSAMEQVYKSDPLIAATVDQAVEARGLSRSEATEEYLADYAAVLDMSLLRRVAAAMKNALNAVGFKFSDDMVRHLLRMSRRYVRNGKRDSLFSTSDIFQDIQAIESGTDQLGTGRFREGFTRDNIRTDMLGLDVYGHLPRTAQDISDALKPGVEKLSNKTESAVRKFFSLTAFNALDNPGLSRLIQIVQRGSDVSMRIRNAADEMMADALNREFRFFGVRIAGGITETEQLAASRLNYGQQDSVRGKVDAKVDAVVKALRDKKRPTYMFTFDGTEVKENTAAIAAYIKAGRLTLPQAKELLAKDKRYKKIAEELTDKHPTWTAYIAGREAFEFAELEFVKAQYVALKADRDNAALALLDLLPDPAGNADKVLPAYANAMFKTWTDVYTALYAEDASVVSDNLVPTERSAKTASEFSRTVNEALIAKGFDTQKEDAIRGFFKGKEADDFIAQLVKFRKLVAVDEDNKFVVQQKVAQIGAASLSYSSAELSARKLLVQGYTQINRPEEGFQIRTQAYDPTTGELLQMHDESRDRAVYRAVGTAEEGTQLAKKFDSIFSDTNIPDGAPSDIRVKTIKTADGKTRKVRVYRMLVRKKGESEFKVRDVVVRADVSAAATGVSTPLNLNLNEFIRGLRQYGLNIQPSKLEQIVVDMTAQDARARKRLEQTGNPGYEVQNGVTAFESIARHIDGRASLTAKIQMRPEIDRLMNTKLSDSRKLWFGDNERLRSLKSAYDKAVASGASESDVYLAKREYDRYATQMSKTQTVVNGRSVNMGNKYLSEGHSLLTFINGNRDVNESDWGSGPVASFLRRWISAAQLGGSLAQPIMNNVGPFTNFIPWLGSINGKTGFGGGAGFTNAYTQYLRAMSDVGGAGGVSFTKQSMEMHTAEYWSQVATGLTKHDGVSKAEAEFIANETLSGVLTPAQANNLLGYARNYTTNPAVRQVLDKWMFFYLSSEQSTRRAAALAAFRVEWERQLARKGVTADKLSAEDYKKIHRIATDFAAEGVNLTLGDYKVINRPAAWRSGFQSFLYMYRVWPTTTIQTFSRLSLGGKAAMAIPLLALSGLAGLPFAEDGEDLIDTILQRSGSSIGSIRLEAARLIDEVFPGASPFVLNGFMSNWLGTDVAGRFSAGDFIPGSGAFLPGQDPYQTFKEVAGPAWGFLEGVAKGGSQAVAAPFSETATFVDAAREGPITLLRALGDAAAYTSAGAVVDKRGYVIDEDLTTSMLVSRVLGFTPASVAAQYELIRLAKRETNYQKQVVAKFRTSLLKAELAGDREAAASIRRTVREWNAETAGTLLEIRNFEKNYQRLKKQATMSAKERFLKSAGKANQEAVDLIGELVMYD